MTIEDDVRGIATTFGLDPKLVQAVVNAEGNIIRAVQCSIPAVTTRDQALRILCRSAVHALSDYVKGQQLSGDFVAAWAAKWAPIGATNDPKGLNQNWAKNVIRGWLGPERA